MEKLSKWLEKDLTAITKAVPYIMTKRYDAQNWSSENLDADAMRAYIREKWKEGRAVTHMSMIVAAYYKAVLKNPKINDFVMNGKIYRRNHFCFSFVQLKTRADGTPDEATLKVMLDPKDEIFSITEKIRETIEQNSREDFDNSTDKFANFLFSVPGLARLVIGLAKFLDKHNILPKFIIDLSPFHTSLFVTNLASIKTNNIYHHCYEFGTTSVFVCMGRPVPDPADKSKKFMPMTVVMDERIATGVEYSRFFDDFLRNIRDPKRLEQPFDGSAPRETAKTEAQ
ncbi:MAG: hypothetical protein IKN53_04385 [Oscillibacter sp.]|nr:hypothetical protein [Oscillibacter sp.]